MRLLIVEDEHRIARAIKEGLEQARGYHMVTLLYALILIPAIAWVIAFGYETWLALKRSETGNYKLGASHIHASWEITHTLLVYTFTVFLISHADALVFLDSVLFVPVCVFMIALIARGCLYLYLFYGEDIKHPNRWHNAFALTHIVSLIAVLVGIITVTVNLLTYSFFEPNTDNLPIVAVGFVLTFAVCAVPIWAAYHQRDDS